MAGNGNVSLVSLTSGSRSLGSSAGLSVPVEIVDTSTGEGPSTTTVLQESNPHQDHDGLSQDDSMEISLEEISQHAASNGQSLADTLAVVSGHHSGGNHNSSKSIEDIVLSVPSASVDSTQLTPLTSNTQHGGGTLSLPGIQTSNSGAPLPATPVTPTLSSSANLGIPIDGTALDPHLALQQVSQHFQEVSRSLRNEGIEISPESLASHFPQSLAEVAALIGQSSQTNNAATTASLLESVINQSSQGLPPIDINYSDLTDVGRVINNPNLTSSSSGQIGSTQDEIDAVLGGGGEPHVPSSPDSNFDTSDLLNNTLTQDVELTTKLANAGPVGVAAAAAILSGRKRRRHVFESNPALRKRHCSKLMRKLKETLDELSTRVGLQACVVTYRPSSKQEKPEPSFKVFGTSPLLGAIEEQRGRIVHRMDEQLKKQIPQTPPTSLSTKHVPFELPPLVFEGIPAPVNEMTQAQLRCFIPSILKFSTGRGKPGWGKEDMKPVWWPVEVPWQNVRSDVRNESQKKTMSWTECLRKTVIACYTHHGRQDLLQAASNHKLHEEDELTNETAQQLQLHLEHQHGGIDLSALQDHNVMDSNEGVTALTSSRDQSLVSDQQQVFTIDTGMGNCDTSGMPTLADASLAETAARLQQVADETNQVQYATQTVTVTERDSKALGQPVGSTTTVLLTAYPSGQTVGDTQQQYYQTNSSSGTSTTPGNNTSTPSVQVVYSASHVNEMSDSIVTGTDHHGTDLYGTPDTGTIVSTDNSNRNESLSDSTDYFTRATSSSSLTDPTVHIDLASEYISGYTAPKRDVLTTTVNNNKELSLSVGSGIDKNTNSAEH